MHHPLIRTTGAKNTPTRGGVDRVNKKTYRNGGIFPYCGRCFRRLIMNKNMKIILNKIFEGQNLENSLRKSEKFSMILRLSDAISRALELFFSVCGPIFVSNLKFMVTTCFL
jgi:hypothetical protein